MKTTLDEARDLLNRAYNVLHDRDPRHVLLEEIDAWLQRVEAEQKTSSVIPDFASF